jgi:dTDP-4-dehydrorhamnose reductase
MRVVVTGQQGQVAQSLVELAGAVDCKIVALGRPTLDLAATPESIHDALAAAAPDVIVSAAAYTFVDKAESEPDAAFAVNANGAEAVARAANLLGVPLVHLSTDYVYDGTKREPYVEQDKTGPRTVYGASKLAGEQRVLAAHPDSVVLRTAWVFSPFGTNFVRTMLRLAADRDEISVVADQLGSPTSAQDLAGAILAISTRLRADAAPTLRGVFHLTNGGSASWADLAEAVFSASRRGGGLHAAVRRIGTADYPTPAFRPANSRLDCSLMAERYGITLRPWDDAVQPVVHRLLSASN